MTKEINAKFTSRCSACGSTIQPGDRIVYDPAVKYSSRHKTCPAVKQSPKPKVKPGTVLNGPVIAQPQIARLSDEAAAEILAKLGSSFVYPLPPAEPTLGLGSKVSVEGVEREIGTCNRSVGQVTDFKGNQSWVVSLIDGTILDHLRRKDERDLSWMYAKLDSYARQMGAPIQREAHGKGGVKVGDIQHTESGWYIVTSVDKPYYLSADDAEDFDMFGRGGGWGTPYAGREITEPPAEREKREAAAREKATAEAARKQVAEEYKSKFAELTAGLFRAWLDWEFLEQPNPPKVIINRREGESYGSLVECKSKVTGALCYSHPHGGYDDYRMEAFVDAPTRDAINAAWAAKFDISPEAAREWLAKYRGCVGTEAYEWVAAQEQL